MLTINHQASLLLSEVNLANVKIKEKHIHQGVTTDLLTRMWEIVSRCLVQGEYGNLWIRLRGNEQFNALCQGKGVKALKYLFPILIEAAKKNNHSYIIIESDCTTKVPELARLAGILPRYMNTEVGSQVNAMRLKPGPDRWPKFTAIKQSVSVVFLLKSVAGEFFVVVGKNKDNGAGRGKNIGVVTGYCEPHENFEQAAKRELMEETGMQIPEAMELPLIAEAYKQDYYPGADDRNETRIAYIDLAKDSEKTFELKQLEDNQWILMQHKTILIDGRETTMSYEIQAADDLSQVYVLPIKEALAKMKVESSARAKVQAAYKAVKKSCFFEQKTVSYCWSSPLQKYDDVIFTSVHFPSEGHKDIDKMN